VSRTVDVAVIGLGPVGGILSALLGRSGIDTVVIDKADDLYPLPRAAGFDHEIMRILQNLGLADAIQPYTVPYPPTEYRGVGGAVIARYESLPPPYPQGWEPSFMFQQPPFERTIRRFLFDLSSVDVRLSTALEDFKEHDSHVELTMAAGSGGRETLRARYVVGCDGGASLVRRLLGVGLESLGFDEPWLVTDILVDEAKLGKLPETVVQYCDPKRPTTYVIGPGNHRRWEFMLLPGERPEEMNREDAIRRLLGRWLAPDDAKIWRAATYTFHALVAKEWRRGRVFLAGDAAHMTPPFMAQGMCQGIRDAANLAWKVALVLRGAASEALLDTYQRERLPHVAATTETAKSLGRIICELDPAKAAERDARMLAERGNPPAVQYRQNLIPSLANGALLSEQGAPVGMRFPQPRISTLAGERLLDDVVGNSFLLIVASATVLRDLPDALRRTVMRLGGAILSPERIGLSRPLGSGEWSIVETQDVLRAWFSDHGLMAALVRPDHYVFAVARRRSDLETMNDLLQQRVFLVR